MDITVQVRIFLGPGIVGYSRIFTLYVVPEYLFGISGVRTKININRIINYNLNYNILDFHFFLISSKNTHFKYSEIIIQIVKNRYGTDPNNKGYKIISRMVYSRVGINFTLYGVCYKGSTDEIIVETTDILTETINGKDILKNDVR